MSNRIENLAQSASVPLVSIASNGSEKAIGVGIDGGLRSGGRDDNEWVTLDVSELPPVLSVTAVNSDFCYAVDRESYLWLVRKEAESFTARPVGRRVTSVAVGEDGSLWTTEANGNVVQLFGEVWEIRSTEPSMKRVSVGSATFVAGLDELGQGWQWSPAVSEWEPIPDNGVRLVAIAISGEGHLCAVDSDGRLRVWLDDWFDTGLSGCADVALGGGLVWVLKEDGSALGTHAPLQHSERHVREVPRFHTMWDAESVFDESQSTHLWIVNRAARLVTADGPVGRQISELVAPDVHSEGLPFHNGLCQGLYDADFKSDYNNGSSWTSHFYDPDTGKNYRDQTSPTALTEGRRFFAEAVTKYRSAADPAQSYDTGYALGLALHYFTDLTQPMHAANFTALSWPFFYHGDFESFVMKYQNKVPLDTIYSPQALGSTPSKLLIAAARMSKPFMAEVEKGEFDLSRIPMASLGAILSNAIKSTAQFLAAWMETALGNTSGAFPGSIVALGSPQQVAFLSPPYAELHQIECDGGHWVDTNLTESVPAKQPEFEPTSPLAAWDSPMEQLLYRDRHGQIVQFWYEKGWRATDLTAASHGPTADPDTNFATLAHPRQLFFVGDDDGHLHQLWNSGGGWNDTDLTRLAGPMPARSGALTTLSNPAATQQLFYLGDQDGHIHQLYFANGWTHADITALAKAPQPDQSTALTTLGQVTSQVFYIAQDGHVHQLWYRRNFGWVYTDLTAASGAPLASRAAGFASLEPYQQIFFVSDTDSHVHQLWYSDGWKDTDLTALTKAPIADPQSALATLDKPQQQQVFYVSSGGGVHQLWFQGGWRHTELSTG